MIYKKIRAGIIGLNVDGQWASKSHLPALRYLHNEYELRGIANSSYESAQKAATALNIPIAFPNAMELIWSHEIDLVIITVKVPFHFELVKAALEAGKHIYCEHPLAGDLNETKALAALASRSKAIAAVGTQMPFAPEVIFLERLVKEQYIGEVLSTTLIGSGMQWGRESVSGLYYMYDAAMGATMLHIPLAHTLAGFQKVLGGIDSLKATMTSNYKTVTLGDTNETKTKTAADQIMIIGELKNGGAFSVHYRGGVSKGTNFLWEINGTTGDIQVTGNLGHGQLAQLTIMGAKGDEKALSRLEPPQELYSDLPDAPFARNVANIYKNLANDIRNGTRTTPSFDDAVALAMLLNTIEASAAHK
ncbi:Gfo/Idh/MocA family protein [Chitinophaga ginsengisoli]|nr:Gfo/Idh/MocA family oxidoreductase [Chitinophaga ginsengisoli]